MDKLKIILLLGGITVAIYALGEICTSNTNLFSKIIVVIIFVLFSLLLLFLDNERQNKIIKFSKGPSFIPYNEFEDTSYNHISCIDYIKEQTCKTDEEATSAALKYYSQQLYLKESFKKHYSNINQFYETFKNLEYCDQKFKLRFISDDYKTQLLELLLKENSEQTKQSPQ